MRAIFIALSILLVVVFARCSNPSTSSAPQQSPPVEVVSAAALPVGYKLLKRYCYACHNPEVSSHDALLAPPMEAVKFRYLQQFPDRDQFTQRIVQFVQMPTQDHALMMGAISRFGVMTALSVPDSSLHQIADYMYDESLEKPTWFDQHFKEQHGKQGNKGW